jgi:hypothetical protein
MVEFLKIHYKKLIGGKSIYKENTLKFVIYHSNEQFNFLYPILILMVIQDIFFLE